MTHFFDEHVENEFLNLQAQLKGDGSVYLLYHRLPGHPLPDASYPSFVITNDDIKCLGFNMMQDSIVPGHLVFMTILFARANIDFEYIWTIEQDVRFTGNWRSFFREVNQSSADLLTTHVRRYREEPNWWWWKSFHWSQVPLSVDKCLRSFNPINRLSRKAVELVNDSLKRGCLGHSELIVPTLIYNHGMLVEDIGGTGDFVRKKNKRRHYSSVTFKNGRMMHAGSFAAAPARSKPGMRKNRLYHPVKAQLETKKEFFPRLKGWYLKLLILARSFAWQVLMKHEK